MSGKRCSGCGEVKGAESFSRCKSKKDGLKSHCKACIRRYREENREAALEYCRRYHAENREAILERKRRHHAENREAVLERQRRHYEENREAVAERNRRYREENREAVAERDRRYREEHREAIVERSRRYYEENRDMTRESATRIGEPYTPAEDAHILASDEPAAVIAVELGRTLSSIHKRRIELRKAVST